MARKRRKIKEKREDIPQWKFYYLAHGELPPDFDGNPWEQFGFWRSDENKKLWATIPDEKKKNYPYACEVFGR